MNLVTASEMAFLFGLSFKTKEGWKNRQTILREKITRTSEFVDNANTWWGRTLEQPIMAAFAETVGAPYRASNILFQRKGTRVGATIDGLIRAPKEPRGVLASKRFEEFYQDCLDAGLEGTGLIEIKNAERYMSKKRWREKGLSDSYRTQVQTQMYVTGKKWAILVAKCDEHLLPFLELPDYKFHKEIEETVEEFWRDVDEQGKFQE